MAVYSNEEFWKNIIKYLISRGQLERSLIEVVKKKSGLKVQPSHTAFLAALEINLRSLCVPSSTSVEKKL